MRSELTIQSSDFLSDFWGQFILHPYLFCGPNYKKTQTYEIRRVFFRSKCKALNSINHLRFIPYFINDKTNLIIR